MKLGLIGAAAAAALITTPVLAQANTRASESIPAQVRTLNQSVLSDAGDARSVRADRKAKPVTNGSELVGVPLFALLIGAAAIVTTVVVVATDDDDDDVSPGT